MADIFDIIGPIMIGPSSSHTAGAVRMGNLAKNILREDVKKAVIKLHGSFALTWKGHGTDKAILAGLLGFPTDDARIRDAYKFIEEAKLDYTFIETELEDAFHPNSIHIEVWGGTRTINILCSSIGGGVIILDKVNGIEVSYKGKYPTLVIVNKDTPGMASKITNIISEKNINIETMNITPYEDNSPNKGYAVTVIGSDEVIPLDVVDTIRALENIKETILLDKLY